MRGAELGGTSSNVPVEVVLLRVLQRLELLLSDLDVHRLASHVDVDLQEIRNGITGQRRNRSVRSGIIRSLENKRRRRRRRKKRYQGWAKKSRDGKGRESGLGFALRREFGSKIPRRPARRMWGTAPQCLPCTDKTRHY